MKTIVKGFCMLVIILFFILMMLGIFNKTSRQYEIDTSLNSAIMQTMNVLNDQRYIISSNEELISELHRNLLLQINSDCDLDIYIYEVDYLKGILDVEVTATFNYSDNREGAVTSRKTVIIDKIERTA